MFLSHGSPRESGFEGFDNADATGDATGDQAKYSASQGFLAWKSYFSIHCTPWPLYYDYSAYELIVSFMPWAPSR